MNLLASLIYLDLMTFDNSTVSDVTFINIMQMDINRMEANVNKMFSKTCVKHYQGVCGLSGGICLQLQWTDMH